MKIPTIDDVVSVFQRHSPSAEAPQRRASLSPKEVAIFGARAIARDKRQMAMHFRRMGGEQELLNDVLAEAAYLDELVDDWEAGRETYVPAFHRRYYDRGVLELTGHRGAA